MLFAVEAVAAEIRREGRRVPFDEDEEEDDDEDEEEKDVTDKSDDIQSHEDGEHNQSLRKKINEFAYDDVDDENEEREQGEVMGEGESGKIKFLDLPQLRCDRIRSVVGT